MAVVTNQVGQKLQKKLFGHRGELLWELSSHPLCTF